MKEFDYDLTEIFSGLNPKKVSKKTPVTLCGCHNLEPIGEDYQVHEAVIDMDIDSHNWSNP